MLTMYLYVDLLLLLSIVGQRLSTATITGANGRSAIFQVKLVFNHVPSGLIYDGAPLTADILSTLTEAQAKAEMSEVDFAKVQPIIQNAVAVPADIPSTSIQSGSIWIVPNNGAYLIRPKYGSQDDSLWAVVTRLSVSLTWDVNLLDLVLLKNHLWNSILLTRFLQ